MGYRIGKDPTRPLVKDECSVPEAHEAHMRLNGECPWCGAFDEDAFDANLALCEAHGNPDCGLCQ